MPYPNLTWTGFFRFLTTRFLQPPAFIKQFNHNKIVSGRDTMFLWSLGSSWTRDPLVFSEIVLVQDYKHARDSRILLVSSALWQVFTLQPSLAWKSQSYCLSLENAAIAGMRCHSQFHTYSVTTYSTPGAMLGGGIVAVNRADKAMPLWSWQAGGSRQTTNAKCHEYVSRQCVWSC